MSFHTLGKPKELKFQLWLKLSEKFMKDPVWWCGLWFFCVIIIPTPVWVFDLDFDWGVAMPKELKFKLWLRLSEKWKIN